MLIPAALYALGDAPFAAAIAYVHVTELSTDTVGVRERQR